MMRRNRYRKRETVLAKNNLTLVNHSTVSKGSSDLVLFFCRMIDLHVDSMFSRHMRSAVTAVAD